MDAGRRNTLHIIRSCPPKILCYSYTLSRSVFDEFSIAMCTHSSSSIDDDSATNSVGLCFRLFWLMVCLLMLFSIDVVDIHRSYVFSSAFFMKRNMSCAHAHGTVFRELKERNERTDQLGKNFTYSSHWNRPLHTADTHTRTIAVCGLWTWNRYQVRF